MLTAPSDGNGPPPPADNYEDEYGSKYGANPGDVRYMKKDSSGRPVEWHIEHGENFDDDIEGADGATAGMDEPNYDSLINFDDGIPGDTPAGAGGDDYEGREEPEEAELRGLAEKNFFDSFNDFQDQFHKPLDEVEQSPHQGDPLRSHQPLEGEEPMEREPLKSFHDEHVPFMNYAPKKKQMHMGVYDQ